MTAAPTAIVHPGARIHPTSTIGEYSIIEDGVEIGPNCRIDSHVVIKRYTTLGEGNHIHSGAQLGIDPMDKKFREENRSYLRIGNNNVFREYATVSRATQPEAETTVGDNNYIMSYVHIAHDCHLAGNITICTCTGLAGHCTIEDGVFMSHGIGVHQFSRVGRLSMVAANTRINKDIPPYFLVSEFDAAAHGLNLVGLRRAGFSRETLLALKQAYRLLYRSGLNRDEALARIDALNTPETTHLAAFIRSSKRGICPDYRSTLNSSE